MRARGTTLGIIVALVAAAGAGAQGAADIIGTEGDDVLVGTAADDRMFGGGGNDRLDGRAGDDQLDGGAGADILRGGDGVDSVVYGGAAPVKVSLDGVANDGTDGEGDVVSDDVEAIYTGSGADALTGGNGEELLDGGAGDDALDGDNGEDHLFGGPGDDTLNGVDASIDVVDCGEGKDLASVDEFDRVIACETVVRAAQPRVSARVGATWAFERRRTSALRLPLSSVPADAIVELRCRSRDLGCRRQRRVVTISSGRGDAAKALLGARLRRGAVVELRITQPGSIGQVVRWTVRGKSGPLRRDLCLRAGAERASRC